MNPKPSHRKPVVAAMLLGVALFGLALDAQAGEPAAPNRTVTRVSVSYADLDLSHPAGARALYARLRAAARQACGPEPSARELRQHASYKACYEGALNRAVHRIGSERLHAVHAAHGGRSTVG